MTDTRSYEDELAYEAFGVRSNPLRQGGPAGNGMKIIPELVKKLPPFPFDYTEARRP